MQNWKQLLFEETSRSDLFNRYFFFCDLDGCLVNWDDAVVPKLNESLKKIASQGTNAYGQKLYNLACRIAEEKGKSLTDLELVFADIEFEPKEKTKIPRKFMYLLLSQEAEWWKNLPWMPDGKELWEYYSRFNPYILTAPMGDSNSPCSMGKRSWCQNNLGYDLDQIIVSSDKSPYASYQGKQGFLVDDMEKHLLPFKAAGGDGILHISAANTIRELQKKGVK